MNLIRMYRAVTPKKIRRVVGKLFYSKKMFPHIAIELNTSCTRRCSYCPNSIYDRGLIENEKLMKENLFKKIINELSALGYFGLVDFSFYGEPLLDKRLPKFIEYAREKLPSANLHIATNGDLLNLEIYKKLADAGVDKILITRHSPTTPKGVHDAINYNKKRSKGVKIQLRFFGKDTELFNRAGLVKINPKNQSVLKKCFMANDVNIDYDGNVVLCCNDYLSSIKFGNVNKEKLIDIWNKSNYKKIREDLEKGIFNLEICKKCVGRQKIK